MGMSQIIKATLAASLASLAGAAGATTVTITEKGTVTSFVDVLGAYGIPGADYAGAAITDTYVFDLAPGVFTHGSLSPTATYQNLHANIGGLDTATSTINGHTASYNIYENAYSQRDTASGVSATEQLAINENTVFLATSFVRTTLELSEFVYSGTLAIPETLTGSYTVSPSSPCVVICSSGIIISDQLTYDLTTGTVVSDPAYYGYFNETQLTVSTIPEPVTWTLMLVGIGLTGAALRSVRRQPALTLPGIS